MRNGRVGKNEDPVQARRGGIGVWVSAIAAICALWLAAMVVISYFGLEYKLPTRIENWKPRPNPGRG